MLKHRTREAWVDNVKAVACVLVALGHFFQSVVSSGVIQENWFTGWFDRTVYFFHVPLFFICSGYVYQKYSGIHSLRAHCANIGKKAVTLGMPYVMFTGITWLLKTVFASEVNRQIDGLLEVLVLRPTSPYWYLYALFFIFAVTPRMESRKGGAVALGVAALAYCIGWKYGSALPRCASYVLSNEIWFVIGMNLSLADFGRRKSAAEYVAPGCVLGALFVLLSAWIFSQKISLFGVDLLMGLLGCGGRPF